MAKRYSTLDFAEDILKKIGKPLLYQEIWQKGKHTEYAKKLGLTGKTPWQTIGARLFVDIRDNPNSKFVKVGRNPARFYLKDKVHELPKNILAQIQKEEEKETKPSLKIKERDLHPLLSYFAYTNTEFNKGKEIYTKTIYHEKSKKSGLNEWVHPDIVGFYMPITDWDSKLLEFNDISDSNSIILYSFELKLKIDKSNYRESFFQTVSNSSWANEGYLVTADLKRDDDLLSELERLSSAFGIGIIIMDLDDIDSSTVLYSSKVRSNLDWNLMNKLCEQNKDFNEFIDNVTKDYKVKTTHKESYDSILADPAKYIRELKRKK